MSGTILALIILGILATLVLGIHNPLAKHPVIEPDLPDLSVESPPQVTSDPPPDAQRVLMIKLGYEMWLAGWAAHEQLIATQLAELRQNPEAASDA